MGIAESVIHKSYEECVELIKVWLPPLLSTLRRRADPCPQEFEAADIHSSNYSKRIAHGIIKLYESTLPSFIRPLFTSISVSFLGP